MSFSFQEERLAHPDVAEKFYRALAVQGWPRVLAW
jgi:hypothetical protein